MIYCQDCSTVKQERLRPLRTQRPRKSIKVHVNPLIVMNLGDRFDIFLSLQKKDDRMFSDDLNKELKLLKIKLTTVVQRTGGKDTKLPRLRVTFAIQSVSYC